MAGGERKPRVLANDIFQERYLSIYQSEFACPLCQKTWERGGHKEGFVKASAQRHVYNCWQVGLFLRGYVVGDYSQRGHLAMSVAEAVRRESAGALYRGFLASYRRAVSARRKQGVLRLLAPPAT